MHHTDNNNQACEKLTLTFTDTTLLGAGVSKHNGAVIFTDCAVEGDTADVILTETKKNYCKASLKNLITASSYRTVPDCPVYEKCGGCSLRHISYEYELEVKRRAVESALRRNGIKNVTVDTVISASPERYRNKAVLHFSESGIPGYYSESTHLTVAPDNFDCLLHPQFFSEITEFTRNHFAGIGRHPDFLYIRSSEATDTFTVVIGGNKITAEDAKKYSVAARQKFSSLSGVFFTNSDSPEADEIQLIDGDGYLDDVFCSLKVRISPKSFYQVNHSVAEQLVKTACDYADLKYGETAVDLYCGMGIFGMAMAKRQKDARIIGVEINPHSIANAKENAARNNIDNIEFFCGDSAGFANYLGNKKIDCAVIDPPRKGCSGDTIDELKRLKPQRIVYVSCNPATLARDLKLLTEKEYSIEKIVAADMFPRTSHVETVVLLSRRVI